MNEVFEMTPAGSGVTWFFGVLILFFVAILALFIVLAWSTANSSFELSDTELKLRGDLWGRSIPLSSLRVDEARVVDLHRERELLPHRKTMGSALPGYSSGWFKLRNGEKALLYLTNRQRSVYIPTTDGYSLLLSPAHPDRFLTALQRSGS